MTGLTEPRPVLRVVHPKWVEQRDRQILGREPGRLGAPLPEPLVPPAILQDVAANLLAGEAVRALDQDVEFQAPFPRLGESLGFVGTDQVRARRLVEDHDYLGPGA